MMTRMKDLKNGNFKIVEISIPDMLARYSALSGVFGVLFTWLTYPEGIYTGFIFGVAAAALGIAAKKGGSEKGSATFGLVSGIIGTLFCVFMYLCLNTFYDVIVNPATREQVLSMFSDIMKAYGLSAEDFVQLMNP